MERSVRQEAEAAPPGEDELQLGATERAAAANGVVLALVRAARSFLLYDPGNEAIRHFLGALKSAVEGYLAVHGALPLVVRPFELVAHGEVVYLDRDRERSLAFRLFRDGVRKIVLEPGLTWAELLKLLEVLSIRYVGVRQAEDDMVVLLWKAGFQHIQLEAVEGFVPDEEEDDAGPMTHGGGVSAERAALAAPKDFDLPAPALQRELTVDYIELSESERADLVEEDSAQALPLLAVRMIRELLDAAADPTDPLEFAECIPLLREIRDFLLSEDLLARVFEMVHALAAFQPVSEPDRAARDALLASFAEERSLARLLRSVPRDATQAPAEMVSLLERLPGNHLPALLFVLETEFGEATRRVSRSLIERLASRNSAWILSELGTLPTSVALELLRALARSDPARAIDAVPIAVARREPELQLEALRILGEVPLWPGVGRLLLQLLDASEENVRVGALALVGRRGIRAAFPVVEKRARRASALGMGEREATACGEALALADPVRAEALFRGWLGGRGFFSRLFSNPAMLQWVAAAGSVHIAGDEIEALVRAAAARGTPALAEHCARCLARRGRAQRESAEGGA